MFCLKRVCCGKTLTICVSNLRRGNISKKNNLQFFNCKCNLKSFEGFLNKRILLRREKGFYSSVGIENLKRKTDLKKGILVLYYLSLSRVM